MGQSGVVVGQVPHFDPFPFEKFSKRVENQVPPNPVFSIPYDSLS